MILSSQYFRPPFPDRARWRDDLRHMRDTGLTHMYLWANWGWMEPEPGTFVFDDYDELIELAGATGLKVIINTIAEVQPAWIHREVPGAELVDHTGRHVTSSTLSYSHVGVMPGGCFDHPDIAGLSGRFLRTVAGRYAGAEALAAWDCWNEMRWSSQSDGYVCYCDHTLASYRRWLDTRYGGLDGLRAAWRRRIASWEDVQPGRVAGRSFTDLMEFQAFLTDRTAAQLRFRYDQIRGQDPGRPIAAHTAFPATYFTGTGFLPFEHALARGDDFDMAEIVDAFGSSQFPQWFDMAPSEFGARIESGRSAVGDKPYWVAELQGGAHRHGIAVTEPVPGPLQQRWVWTGYARGAKTVNFWCWRDEIFGREASGFGIVGDDGHKESRLAGLRDTAGMLRESGPLLDGYRPEAASIGVAFSPAGYRLDWAQRGAECDAAGPSLQGYLYALERLQLPYRVINAKKSDPLDGIRFVIVPWAMIVEPPLAETLTSWVHAGGTLLLESEADSYDQLGFYRYPGERPFADGLGVSGQGRRPIRSPLLDFTIGGTSGRLRAESWIEAFEATGGEVFGTTEHGPAIVGRRFGAGQVIALGTHAGLAYERERYPDFERFVETIAGRAGALNRIRCSVPDGDVVQWRYGRSGDVPMLFVTNAGPATTVTFTAPAGTYGGGELLRDLATGQVVKAERAAEESVLTLSLEQDGYRVLAGV